MYAFNLAQIDPLRIFVSRSQKRAEDEMDSRG
jgi:hypothetical protein